MEVKYLTIDREMFNTKLSSNKLIVYSIIKSYIRKSGCIQRNILVKLCTSANVNIASSYKIIDYLEKKEFIKIENNLIFDNYNQNTNIEKTYTFNVKAPTNTATTSNDITDFIENFWDIYPIISKKQEVENYIIENQKELLILKDEILNKIPILKNSNAWKKNYIPAPLKFLKDKRWTDDLEIKKEKKKEIKSVDINKLIEDMNN